ncbi:cGMP-dependent protein kinase 1-like [Pyrus ussuriensis x Pyrus communis]|uniref:cGMP-dependent protein kinase 1-like n=1 Tax=Pyrus ussuriensis x Pyrus communis TaxID=2448454 RepID=A0A5N5HSJ9_9ROSA|nr:cGMP-dependent protein kinase 1-like [Pyrus ussuriensis x Pyrus communis]
MYKEHCMLADLRSMHVEIVKSYIHKRTQTIAGACRSESKGIRLRSACTRLKFHIPQSSTNLKSRKAEHQLELLGRQKKFPDAQLLRYTPELAPFSFIDLCVE